MSKPIQPLIGTIDRFEGQKAVIRFKIDYLRVQELIIPKNYLPKNSREGHSLILEFSTEEQINSRRKDLAQQILKEILKSD